MRDKTCTTDADAPAFPPDSARLDALDMTCSNVNGGVDCVADVAVVDAWAGGGCETPMSKKDADAAEVKKTLLFVSVRV